MATSSTSTPLPTSDPPTSTSTTSSTTSSPPTSPPPSSTTTSSPSSTSSSTSPSSSSSSTSSTTLPTSTSTTPTTTSTTPTPTTTFTSASLTTSNSGGHIVTQTTFVAVTPTPSTTLAGSNGGGSSKSFFQNTGAVAGVFTVVGLIVVALIIALITNILRRRRAKRFDREIEEAAAEAAAAPAPIFLDDADDDYGHGGYGGGGYNAGGQYSDASSHGTYAQPAMSSEAYGMRELGPGPGAAPGELYTPYGAAAGMGAAGAAGVGVARSRSARDPGGFANGLMDGSSPYPAFAAPGGYVPQQQPQQQRNYANVGAGYNRGPGNPEFDLLDAAGMGAAGAGAGGMQRGISLSHQPQYPELSRNPSQARSTETGYSQNSASASSGPPGYSSPPPVPESYASHYVSGAYSPPRTQDKVEEDDEDDANAAYGGYVAEPHAMVPPGKAPGPGTGRDVYHPGDESSVYDDDEEDNNGRRVLKVANE